MSDIMQRRRVAFDPTINLGHVLTFVGFMIAGFSAYSTLDKRVTLMESQIVVNSTHVRDQDSRLKETLSDFRSDVKELQRTFNFISRSSGTTTTQAAP
ncbi:MULTISPECIES: DUF2730 domain-containing protein [unclassified Comamonas]|uniref:DUF2730 domain-containing protein n=1 Tax=unclassified Comamonas TaxID=2638500 RepID=UPI001FA75D5B|nr:MULTISPECIES: DUF2730 domain-containing protein [unclassified Comamonas]UNV91838.1 DUF2730 domain-containing protein [Comamonas sp. 7D-2evo1]UNV94860.1 DUF2730 domain-containing protein [Comamonas sp. 7D-2]UNW01476.1 DUF2730 domain-containing protein [Comamonas sp. 7D-2evo2]